MHDPQGTVRPRLSGLFAELRQRHVFRVAAAYAVAAWLVIQVAATIAPVFDLPDWIPRVVVIVVAVGFPIALLVAYLYDATPDGFERTKVTVRTRPTGPSLRWLVAGALAVGIGTAAYVYRARALVAPAHDSDGPPSLIVMPFEEGQSATSPPSALGKGLQQVLSSELASIETIRVFEPQPAGGDAAAARGSSAQASARFAVLGGVLQIDDRVRIVTRVVDIATGEVVETQSAEGATKQLLGMTAWIANEIARELGATVSPERVADARARPEIPAEAVTPFSRGEIPIEAITLFSRAQVFANAGRTERARELYEQIIREFPGMTQARNALDRLETARDD
jgi:TolB-like protein